MLLFVLISYAQKDIDKTTRPKRIKYHFLLNSVSSFIIFPFKKPRSVHFACDVFVRQTVYGNLQGMKRNS